MIFTMATPALTDKSGLKLSQPPCALLVKRTRRPTMKSSYQDRYPSPIRIEFCVSDRHREDMKTFVKIISAPTIFSIAWLCLITLAGSTPPNPDDPQDTYGLPIILLYALLIFCLGVAAIAVALIGNVVTLKFAPSNKKWVRYCFSLIANTPLLLLALFSAAVTFGCVNPSALSMLTIALFLASAATSMVTTKRSANRFGHPT
ncbi:hypothetical protein D3C81_815560 [compost metagenome]